MLKFPVLADPSFTEPAEPQPKAQGRWAGIKLRPVLTQSPVKANPFNGKVDVPADIDLAKARVYLVCEDVAPEAAARVTLNGRDAGGFIGRPLRLNVTGFLNHGSNAISIAPFAPAKVSLVVYKQ